jgi:hypothetical protein
VIVVRYADGGAADADPDACPLVVLGGFVECGEVAQAAG